MTIPFRGVTFSLNNLVRFRVTFLLNIDRALRGKDRVKTL